MEEDDLRSITTLFSEFSGPVFFEATCSDKADRKFPTVDALLSYENPSRRAIRELTIRTEWSSRKQAKIKLTNDPFWNDSFEFEASGTDDEVVHLEEKVQDIVSGMQPWYSFAATARTWLAAFLLFSWFVVFGLFWDGDSVPDWITYVRVTTLVIGAVLYVAGLFQKRLFPLTVFAIGQGRSRQRNGEIVRQVIVVGFAISVLSGLILTPLGLLLT